MTQFVDHDRSEDAWWAAVSPYLDPQATYDHQGTDPRLVPASKVTGDGQVSAAPSSTEVTVLVPTNIGQYRVTLVRQVEDGGLSGPWLVHDITPPDGAGS